MSVGYIATETTYKDGRPAAFRFTEVEKKKDIKSAWAYCNERADRFLHKPEIKDVRLIAVTAETVARARSKQIDKMPDVNEWEG